DCFLLGLGLAGKRLVAGSFAHGTRPGSASRNGDDVGLPSSRLTTLGGRSLSSVQEVERYWLEIVGLTSTHSLGSGTLHYSGVAQGLLPCVVSSDLRPYVLDTQVKRGAELSTDHHLVVSWIQLAEEEVGQTWQTQTYCEGLLGMSGRALCQGGLQLPPPEELLTDS
ncbi:hypothetical protein L3Q82_021980, partial [Scortum barcoo]